MEHRPVHGLIAEAMIMSAKSHNIDLEDGKEIEKLVEYVIKAYKSTPTSKYPVLDITTSIINREEMTQRCK